MKKLEKKFRIEELGLLDFKYWKLSLRPQQSTLGASIISLKRECISLSLLTKQETSELQKVFKQTEFIIKESFSCDKVNYLCLMMIDNQVHFHVIPRFSQGKIFNETTFSDSGWPNVPILDENEPEEDILFSIKNEMLKQIPNKKKQVVGYTTGVYDLFHIGHLNVLRKAKESCDKLIVGVTTDELSLSRKKKLPIIPFNERSEIVASLDFVDEVVPQSNMDKLDAWEKYKFDKMFVGDDWKGNPTWDDLGVKFEKVGVEIVYFSYTKSTSSTILRDKILKTKE